MNKFLKSSLLLMLSIVCASCGKTSREEFMKKLEINNGFKCGTSQCQYNYKEESHDNGVNHYLNLEHRFDFGEKYFHLGYSLTDFKNNDVYYEDSWAAVYYYDDDSIYSKSGKYEYDYQKKELTIKGIFLDSDKKYNCYETKDNIIKNQCELLKQKCENVRGMFYNYLGEYTINDLQG